MARLQLQSHLTQVSVSASTTTKRGSQNLSSLIEFLGGRNQTKTVLRRKSKFSTPHRGDRPKRSSSALCSRPPRFDSATDQHPLPAIATDIALRQANHFTRRIRQQRCVHFVVAAARIQEETYLFAPYAPLEKDPFVDVPSRLSRVCQRNTAAFFPCASPAVKRRCGQSAQSGWAVNEFSPIMKFSA